MLKALRLLYDCTTLSKELGMRFGDNLNQIIKPSHNMGCTINKTPKKTKQRRKPIKNKNKATLTLLSPSSFNDHYQSTTMTYNDAWGVLGQVSINKGYQTRI